MRFRHVTIVVLAVVALVLAFAEWPTVRAADPHPGPHPTATSMSVPDTGCELATNGCESDEDCPDDGLYCNGDEYCDLDGHTCAHTGDPCLMGTYCHEDLDHCCIVYPCFWAEACFDDGSGVPDACIPLGCGEEPPYNPIEPRLQLGTAPTLRLELGSLSPSVDAEIWCEPHAYSGTITVTTDGSEIMEISFSDPLPSGSCCTVYFLDSCCPGLSIILLGGDVNRDGQVSTADSSSVKARLGQTAQEAGPVYDVNHDGAISTADASSVKARLENNAVPCSCPE